MNSIRLVAAMLLFGWAVTAFAVDTTPDDFKTGPIDCDVLKNNPDARYKILMDSINRDEGMGDYVTHIGELRKKFWATYPDKPGHKEIRDAFAEALYVKDMMYLQVNLFPRIIRGDNDAIKRKRLEGGVNKVISVTGNDLDGGIPEKAQFEFLQWVDAAVEKLGPARETDDIFKKGLTVGLGILSENFRKISDPGGKAYQEYIMERDWAEFDRAGVLPVGFDSKEGYGMLLYFRHGKFSFGEASRIYKDMVRVLGKDVVESAAEAVRKAPKTESGSLVIHVPRPVKKGPGGDEVDDDDVPFPPGVIGVYGNPEVAMEVGATCDDDRRYLLYVMKEQFTPYRNWLGEETTKWQFAANWYQTLVHAFGEARVLEVAHTLRLAPKRLTNGTVMNSVAIGSDRQIPWAAFSDVLARKDPRGYVRQMLAFKQDFKSSHTVDIDAAYQKFIREKSNDEAKVLDAAKRMAAGRPNLGSAYELDQLTKVLNGSVTLEKTPVENLVDFPLYVDWKRFAPGTAVMYATRVWLQDQPGTDHLAPRRWLESRQGFTLQSVTAQAAKLWRTTQVFDSTGTPHPPRDLEIGYPAKFTPPPGWFASIGSDFRGSSQPSRPGTVPTTSGQETLVVSGRQIATKWTSEIVIAADSTITTKMWTSAEVPTGLVRMLEETVVASPDGRRPGTRYVRDTYLESVTGITPGTAAPAGSQPLTPPGPLSAELARKAALKTAASDTPSRQIAPQPPVQPQNAPNTNAQAARTQRYTTVLKRAGNAAAELNRLERVYSVSFPADVSDARKRLNSQLAETVGVMGTGDQSKIDPALQSLDGTVSVIEKYLKERQQK